MNRFSQTCFIDYLENAFFAYIYKALLVVKIYRTVSSKLENNSLQRFVQTFLAQKGTRLFSEG